MKYQNKKITFVIISAIIFLSVFDIAKAQSTMEYGGGGGSEVSPSYVSTPSSDGECGPAAKSYDLKDDSFKGDFCIQGIMDADVSFPAVGSSTAWICTGFNNGRSTQCIAKHERFNTVSTTTVRLVATPQAVSEPSVPGFFELLIKNLRSYFSSLLKKKR